MPQMPASADWTYYPPGNVLFGDVDVVRFYVQDTDPGVRLLGDLEIQYLIDEWVPKYDSLVYVAAVAADVIAAKFAGVVSVSADGVSVNVADLYEKYVSLAAQLRQQHKDAQVGAEVDIRNLMWAQQPDWDIDPLQFGVGMHDSAEAGRQNWGSHRNAYPFPEDTVRPG